MGHVLHARARTTPEVRREIQNSQESLITLSKRYGVNPKTVEKWRGRDFVHDAPMGPKVIRSKSLSLAEEAIVVTFRVYTQLPLDDCLYSLQEIIPHLSRSALHRCLQRHGLSRLPKEKDAPKKRSLNRILSGISIWILPKYKQRKVSSIFLSASTEHQNSHTHNCISKRQEQQPKVFWKNLSRQFLIRFIQS